MRTERLPVQFYMTDKGRASPTPTGMKAHACNALIRLVWGPVGTGKSCWAVNEMQKHIINHPDTDCCIVRETYPQLHDSTIPDTFRYFSPNLYRIPSRKDKCWNQQHKDLQVIDNGIVRFRSTDSPEKFQSMDRISFVWIEEAADIPEDSFLQLVTRPRRTDIPITIILTSYAPDPKSWLYDLFWANPDKDHVKFFFPRDENEGNLRPGYYDHLRRIFAHRPDWTARYIEGQCIYLGKGDPVTPGFSHAVHTTSKILKPMPGHPILRSWDFGFDWSAVVWAQLVPVNRLAILGSVIYHYQDIDEVAPQVVAQGQEWFGRAEYRDYCGADAGYRTPQSRETIEEKLAKRSIEPEWKTPYPGCVEDRLNIIRGLLLLRDDKRPGLMICKSRNETLVEALAGGYCMDSKGRPDKGARPHADVMDALGYMVHNVFDSAGEMEQDGQVRDSVDERHPPKRRWRKRQLADTVDQRHPRTLSAGIPR